MSDLSVDSVSPGTRFDPAAEEEQRRQRVSELQARLKVPTNYPGRAADEKELKRLEADQGARRDLAAGNAHVVVDPTLGNAAQITLHKLGLKTLPTFERPDMTTPVANMSVSQRQHQIVLLKSIIDQNPHTPDPTHLRRFNELLAVPPMVPIEQLHSVADVDAAISRERAFVRGPSWPYVSPQEKQAHQQYLAALEKVRANPIVINDGRPLLQKLQDQEHARIAQLRQELVSLGDTHGCTDHDTIENLTARRDRLLYARQDAADTAAAKRLYMGLDGRIGNAEQLGAYELAQRVEAINPGSGTGALFAGIAASRGASIEEIRAAGQAGNMIEGLGGGVGHALNANRAGNTGTAGPIGPSGARRPTAGPGLGPRVRAPTNGPTPRVEPLPRDGGLRDPTPALGPGARPRAPSLPRAAGVQEVVRNPVGSLPPSERITFATDGVAIVNGQRVINSAYAGKVYPASQYRAPAEVAAKYPNGVRFTKRGFPDFSPYARDAVKVSGLTGDNDHDFRLANAAAGYGNSRNATPEGFTWHHCEDGVTMQLVPSDIHDAVRHTGGASILGGGT